jgi:hypothetical protein
MDPRVTEATDAAIEGARMAEWLRMNANTTEIFLAHSCSERSSPLIRVHSRPFAVGTLPFIRVRLQPVRHSRPQSRHVLLRLAMADPFAVALFP